VLGVKKSKGKPKGLKKAVPRVTPAAPRPGEYRVMTVALIREPEGVEAVEMAFSESARFYRLMRVNPGFERILRAFREARENRRPVLVMMESPQSNVIKDVKTP